MKQHTAKRRKGTKQAANKLIEPTSTFTPYHDPDAPDIYTTHCPASPNSEAHKAVVILGFPFLEFDEWKDVGRIPEEFAPWDLEKEA
ncbi:hypothetical protein HDV05_006112, partial [Chytridiales sp. JEL 0842]